MNSRLRAEVRNSVSCARYEITVDGRVVGFAEYTSHGDTVVFSHTEIEPSMRNRGLGAELVRGALDEVRSRGGTVVAQCWYVAQFIDHHPEYADLLAQK